MTTTDTAPQVVATQPVFEDEVVPALLRDAAGLYRMVRGIRIPVNEPGVAVLDGTPAEAAYTALVALDKSATALAEQIDAQKEIIRREMGEKAVAFLHNVHVIDYRYGVENRISAGLAQALLTQGTLTAISTTGTRRPFNLKAKQRRSH